MFFQRNNHKRTDTLRSAAFAFTFSTSLDVPPWLRLRCSAPEEASTALPAAARDGSCSVLTSRTGVGLTMAVAEVSCCPQLLLQCYLRNGRKEARKQGRFFGIPESCKYSLCFASILYYIRFHRKLNVAHSRRMAKLRNILAPQLVAKPASKPP